MTDEQRAKLLQVCEPWPMGLPDAHPEAALVKAAIRAALARIEALEGALGKASAWVHLQGNHPGCRDAADCMLAVIRAAVLVKAMRVEKPSCSCRRSFSARMSAKSLSRRSRFLVFSSRES